MAAGKQQPRRTGQGRSRRPSTHKSNQPFSFCQKASAVIHGELRHRSIPPGPSRPADDPDRVPGTLVERDGIGGILAGVDAFGIIRADPPVADIGPDPVFAHLDAQGIEPAAVVLHFAGGVLDGVETADLVKAVTPEIDVLGLARPALLKVLLRSVVEPLGPAVAVAFAEIK